MIGLEYSLYGAFILAVIFSFYAQVKVSSTFKKYSSYYTAGGKSAADVARQMLADAGIHDVSVMQIPGNLTDHFDPRNKTLCLSSSVYSSTSAAAIGVAAHEAGHAIQHATGYVPIRIRAAMVPATSFASRVSWLLIMIGVLLTAFSAQNGFGYYVLLAGVGLFGITTLFQLVTLPCEFDASKRAMNYIRASSYSQRDTVAAKKVLGAAAMTYVAAMLVSAIQLLRLLVILMGRRNRR